MRAKRNLGGQETNLPELSLIKQVASVTYLDDTFPSHPFCLATFKNKTPKHAPNHIATVN